MVFSNSVRGVAAEGLFFNKVARPPSAYILIFWILFFTGKIKNRKKSYILKHFVISTGRVGMRLSYIAKISPGIKNVWG